MLRSLLLAPLLFVAPVVQAQELSPEQAMLKSHVQFLASDAMYGREAGTRDFDIAAEYVAAQMEGMGLKPMGGGGSWFQPVKLVSFRPSEKAKWTLLRGKESVPFQFGVDFINGPVPSSPNFAAIGGVVFAGYGIVYPQGQRDDYKGLDVKGKIVALLPGTPQGLPNEVSAHFGDDDQKARLAQARGAKAVIMLESNARRTEYAFESIVPYYDYQRNTWAGPDGVAHVPAPGSPVVGYVSQVGAAKLFDGARIKWNAVLAAERSGGKIPTGALAASLSTASKTRVRSVDSRNVIGLIEGSDPKLKDQYLVLSAHLDHVGMGEPVNGDRIYNGAMDNAVGVSMILEVARAIQAAPEKPRRSILVMALTAEEKGLIGSDYFGHNPTVPKDALVADVNLDMPILTYPLVDLVVLGGERSSIGPAVAAAAQGEGLNVVADPAPEEMFFVRSDHYSFVQSGIPAVSIDTGPGGQGAAAQKLFLDSNYHKPSDQLDLPFDWTSAVKFKRVGLATALSLANGDERPSWNKGDFFGVLFGGYGAK